MDRLTRQQRHALLLGFGGLFLIISGLKFVLQWDSLVSQPIQLQDEPALLFFTLEEPCECMLGIVQSAESQIENWPESARAGLPLYRIDFDSQKRFASDHGIYRAPCLVIVNEDGEIIYRQDFPYIEGGSFNLEELEDRIHGLQETSETQKPSEPDEKPSWVFITLRRGCLCDTNVYRDIEDQVTAWDVPEKTGTKVIRVDLDSQRNIAMQYGVEQAPALVLLDSKGEVYWEQDAVLSDTAPFDWEEATDQIHRLMAGETR